MKSTSRTRTILLAGVSTIFFTFAFASSAVSQTWTSTGGMTIARFNNTTTRLPDGRVLAVGGRDCSTGALASAELYDSVSGTWTPAASMKTARSFHTATLLPNGKVLVAGGVNNFTTGAGLASAELYDPATDVWTDTGAMAVGRYVHTATLLASGKVLVAGGESGFPQVFLASAELYDPATGTWSAAGSLGQARDYHTATLLKNGKVLVAGGHVIGTVFASAELYDPGTQTWSGAADLIEPRVIHTATLLSDGQVLVAGGFNVSPNSAVSSAELYNPLADSWTPTGSLGISRYAHTATTLLDGTVLVAGGFNGSDLASAELYDATSHVWTATGALVGAREGHSAVLLSSGAVLAVGGFHGSCLNSAELYNGPDRVPFAAFHAKVEIELGPLANDDAFEVKADFTLGAGSNGIDPLTEDVSLQVGTFSTTIPAGSFKVDKKGRFKFEGVIGGVSLQAKITPLGANSFEFKAEGTGTDLTGTVNPVTVQLAIGDDGGSTTVTAEFE